MGWGLLQYQSRKVAFASKTGRTEIAIKRDTLSNDFWQGSA